MTIEHVVGILATGFFGFVLSLIWKLVRRTDFDLHVRFRGDQTPEPSSVRASTKRRRM